MPRATADDQLKTCMGNYGLLSFLFGIANCHLPSTVCGLVTVCAVNEMIKQDINPISTMQTYLWPNAAQDEEHAPAAQPAQPVPQEAFANQVLHLAIDPLGLRQRFPGGS